MRLKIFVMGDDDTMFSSIPYRAYRNSGVKTSTFLWRGFTLIEITVAVLIVTILAAITIPVFFRTRINMNEVVAIRSIRTLTTAMENYRVANGSYLNPVTGRGVTLAELASATPPYIDNILGCNDVWCQKQGYEFRLVAVSPPGGGSNNNIYWITAKPVTLNETGGRYFCAVEDGVIKYTTNNSILGNYTMCKVWALTEAEILE